MKLYIYGYLNRVRSSRRLEMESHRNIEVIWLVRSLKPDFTAIADFRRDNRAAFRSVLREFVLLCRRLDLYGCELLAVDGTYVREARSALAGELAPTQALSATAAGLKGIDLLESLATDNLSLHYPHCRDTGGEAGGTKGI